MPWHIGVSLITQIVAAFFVAWMLLNTAGLGYMGRVFFVIIFALAAGTVGLVPQWNWLNFDVQYVGLEFADLIVGWFLAGLVLARMCRNGR
jgi:hypothetical protein